MSNLEPLIKSVDDPLIQQAADGLRPTVYPNTPIPQMVRFAPASFAYKVDAHGAGTHVYMYGTDEFGHSVMVRASGFYPYLYVYLDGKDSRTNDPRALVNELESTLLHSLALDAKKWAPERKAAMRACVGTLRRRGNKTFHYAAKPSPALMPIVGYELVPAHFMRGYGGNYGYRGIEQRWMLKIYFYSPAMLVRARNLLHGKHSSGSVEAQCEMLSRSKFNRDETQVAKDEDKKQLYLSQFLAKNTYADNDEDSDDESEKKVFAGIDPDTNAMLEEMEDMNMQIEKEEELGDEWQNEASDDEPDDDANSESSTESTVVEQKTGPQSYEALEKMLEMQFVRTTRTLVNQMRGSNSILSRISEPNPLIVCDADIEFVLRFCIDCGISPCAWVQIDTQSAALDESMFRDDARNGKMHSADGQHPGFANNTWMLNRAPPGVGPSERHIRRMYPSMGPMFNHGNSAESHAQIELRCDFHFIANVADLSIQETVAQHVRFSFDCEMQTGPGGAFPQPETESVISVGIAIPYPARLKNNKKWRLIVFAVDRIAKGPPMAKSDEYTFCFDDERLMLRSFYRYVSLMRPDEFITFNGHNFDFVYLKKRSKVLGIEDEFDNCWSKLRGRSKLRITPRVFQSSAHGQHNFMEISAEGSIFYDIFQTVKRDPGVKTPSYSLNALSEKFLGDRKEAVSPGDINHLQKTPEGRWRLALYVKKDAMLPVRLDENQKWQLGRIEKARITGCTLHMLLERGMGIQGKALIYKKSRTGILIPAVAAEIGIPDAGQTRLCVNYTRTDYDRARESGSYDGAFVVDPTIGVYLMPVSTFDYNSLYPSLQISNNMCVSTIVPQDFDIRKDAYLSLLVRKGKFTWDNILRRIPHVKSARPYVEEYLPNSTRFLRHAVLRGLLPDIQYDNLCRRKQVRLSIKPLVKEYALVSVDKNRTEDADAIAARMEVLEQRQLALKLVANSMYGLTGSDQSHQWSPELAAGVTAHGRVVMIRGGYIAEQLLTMKPDDLLVQQVSQFPGVSNILFTLPNGKDAVRNLFEQINILRNLAAQRPIEMRKAGETNTTAVTAARENRSISSFLGAGRRFKNSSDRVGTAIADESSREPIELDSDVCLRVIYGDSVTGDTALVVRRRGVVQTVRIDELVDLWSPYGDKEQAEVSDLEIWQDGGFTRVARVIRHACHKPIMRVLTHTGVVDCTTDHSLLLPDGTECRPTDVVVGQRLLHESDDSAMLAALIDSRQALVVADPNKEIGVAHAFAMGMFIADQVCCPVVERYRSLFYNEHGEKRIPIEILGAPLAVVQSFWEGFRSSDGSVVEQCSQTSCRIEHKGKEVVAGLWIVARRLGYRVSLNERADEPDVFRLTCTHSADRCVADAIKKIRRLDDYDGFVYDLETESHHFHVAPGNMVVHNTDSFFVRFWRGVTGQQIAAFCKAATEFISICMHVYYGGDDVNDCVFCIEYEKTAEGFLIIAKKKYVMNKYTLEGDKLVAYKNNPSMSGMEAGKRDTTPYVARGQSAVIAILLDKRYEIGVNMKRAVAYIYKELILPLLENRVDLFELVVSKQLRHTIEHYVAMGRNPPIHVQLAALLTRRAGGPDQPGAPLPGDRIPIIVRQGAPGEPVSSRGESPVYAFENGIPIDAVYYIESIAKVLMRIFQPLLTAHRTDLSTDAEREAVTRQYMFGSRTSYLPPSFLNEYEFSEYRDKTQFAPTVVRYPSRRRDVDGVNTLIRDIRPGALCIGCGRFLLGRRTGAVCSTCMQRDPNRFMPSLVSSMAKLQIDGHHLSVERAAIVDKCQTCTGNGQNYTEIKCQEWNCKVMQKRQANMQAMRENEERTNDVSQSLHHDW